MRQFSYFFKIILIAVIFFMFSLPLMGAETKKKPDKEPVRITSDNMVVHNKEKLIIFKGNVVAKKGNATIYSDELKVYHSQEEGKKQGNKAPGIEGNISKIIATGNVRIEQGERQATGQKAEYFSGEQKVVLTGDPVAWEKGNKVSGTEMIFYLDKDTSIVKGNKKRRVNVILFPEEKDKQPEEKKKEKQ